MASGRAKAESEAEKTVKIQEVQAIIKEYLKDQAIHHGLEEKTPEQFDRTIETCQMNFMQPGGLILLFQVSDMPKQTSDAIVNVLSKHFPLGITTMGTAITINGITEKNFLDQTITLVGAFDKLKKEAMEELNNTKKAIAKKKVALKALYREVYTEGSKEDMLQVAPAKRWNVVDAWLWNRTRRTVDNIHRQFVAHGFRYEEPEEKLPANAPIKEVREQLQKVKAKQVQTNSVYTAVELLITNISIDKKEYEILRNAFLAPPKLAAKRHRHKKKVA